MLAGHALSRSKLVAAAAALIVLIGTAGLGSTADAARPATTAGTPLTQAELTTDLYHGANLSTIPADLTPALSKASGSEPIIVTNGCHLQHPGTSSKPCVYGDTSSGTNVVLFGDSHAAAWFPALEKISLAEHWRLLDYTKAGCPPPEVTITLPGHTSYPECNPWRTNTMNSIAALHPALVFASWARYLEVGEASAESGVAQTPGYSVWQDGVDAIFKFLDAHADHVVFMSDAPTLSQFAPACAMANTKSIYKCDTSRTAAIRLPSVKAQELTLAKDDGVNGVDPESWFCDSSECPIIATNIFMYRDDAHMTPEWSDFIEPLLSDTIVPIVQG